MTPVRPLPALQWMATMFCGSCFKKSVASLTNRGICVRLCVRRRGPHPTTYQTQGRGVVVVEREPLVRAKEAVVVVVVPFAAQVVHLVPSPVPRLEEPLHLLNRVAVVPFRAVRRETHGDDTGRDVCQVQVEAVVLEADLVLAHHAAQRVDHAAGTCRGAAGRAAWQAQLSQTVCVTQRRVSETCVASACGCRHLVGETVHVDAVVAVVCDDKGGKRFLAERALRDLRISSGLAPILSGHGGHDHRHDGFPLHPLLHRLLLWCIFFIFFCAWLWRNTRKKTRKTTTKHKQVRCGGRRPGNVLAFRLVFGMGGGTLYHASPNIRGC